MKISTCSISSCRSCQYYTPNGRRGGHCQQLGAPVASHWKACSLACPAFSLDWEPSEAQAVGWSSEVSRLEEAMSLECETDIDREALTHAADRDIFVA